MSDDFRRLVDRCADSDRNFTIHNSSEDHARVLFEKLFSVARKKKEQIRIFSGRCDSNFYDGFVETIRGILESGGRVDVLAACKKSDLDSNRFFQTVKKHRNGSAKTVRGLDHVPHFIVVGNSRYRFEIDDVFKSAKANFGDSLTGTILTTLFDQQLMAHAK